MLLHTVPLPLPPPPLLLPCAQAVRLSTSSSNILPDFALPFSGAYRCASTVVASLQHASEVQTRSCWGPAMHPDQCGRPRHWGSSCTFGTLLPSASGAWCWCLPPKPRRTLPSPYYPCHASLSLLLCTQYLQRPPPPPGRSVLDWLASPRPRHTGALNYPLYPYGTRTHHPKPPPLPPCRNVLDWLAFQAATQPTEAYPSLMANASEAFANITRGVHRGFQAVQSTSTVSWW